MQEKEPLYFTKFREHIDCKFEEINTQLVEINDKLDSHFEEIGELKVEVTKTNMLLMKKADQGDLEKIDKRTKKLESVVFA